MQDARSIRRLARGLAAPVLIVGVALAAGIPLLFGAVPAAGESAATPTAPEGPVEVVATGLANPRSMVWDENGTWLVAQAGTGVTATSVGTAASVVRIDNGCPYPVVSGLPSSFDPFQDVLGPQDITIKNRRIFVLQGATGLIDSWPKAWPNGIYELKFDGTLDLFVDLTTWLNTHPVAHPPGDQNELGEPLRFLPADGGFWVLESNRGELLWVTDAGEVSRIADFSAVHEVWSALAAAPDGGVYIGTLTAAPHFDGDARVMHVTRDGKVETVWAGLTTVTGLVVAPDGTLYALEMATGNANGMRPGTGRIVRQTGPSSLAEVATGLDYPIDMKQGPDGGLYVAMPAYGPNDLAGAILRIEPSGVEPVAVDLNVLAGASCRGAASYAPPGAPAPVAPAAPTAAPVAATPAQQSETKDLTGATAISIIDFTYEPADAEIAVGTTIVWTNNDTVPHTVTALDGSFNSGNMNPGQTWSHTFTKPGDFPYVCLYHPGMKGTVKVS